MLSLVILGSASADAVAQVSAAGKNGALSCAARIPEAELRRVPVYLTASVPDDVARTMGPSIDLIAESVANELRTMLGTHPDTLPRGDARLRWNGLSDLTVVLRREKPLSVLELASREATFTDLLANIVSDSLVGSQGRQLLAEALQRVQSREEPFVVWPDLPRIDSTSFRLRFSFPRPTRDGRTLEDETSRARFLVFSLPIPWMQEALMKTGTANPRYPDVARNAGIGAKVNMQFVIDTNGRADVSTAKHLQKDQAAQLPPDRRAIYDSFVKSVMQTLPSIRFEPATIAGCKVKVLVQLPFEFEVGR